MKTIVTTSLRVKAGLVEQAQAVAADLQLPYVDRQGRSLVRLQEEFETILLVYQTELRLVQPDGAVFVYHPDTALLRIKAPRDPLLELLGEAPKKVLDITMGMASDSLVMAFAGHEVTAVESQGLLHYLVQQGLATWDTGNPAINAAMRSIQTIHAPHLTYLQQQADKSVQVIYMDPMFSERIAESHNLDGMKGLANGQGIRPEVLEEAKRVASEKIILKAHFRDDTFERLGFQRLVRPNQKFHFGVIDLKK